MRLGYHQLHYPLRYCQDWVYILDYSISVGKRKCLVILGISLSCFRQKKPSFALTYQDVQVLSIKLPQQSSGEFVCQTLREVAEQVGQPVQIVSDHGSDVRSGIVRFLEGHPQAHFTYDVTHLLANLLKHHLEKKNTWQQLLQAIERCRNRIQQTGLAFLAPPSIRHRSRFLNLGRVIGWAYKLFAYRKAEDFSAIIPNPGRRKCEQDYSPPQWEALKASQFHEKLDWIESHQSIIEECHELVCITKMINKKVKKEGLSQKTIQGIEQSIHSETTWHPEAKELGLQAVSKLYESMPSNHQADDEVFLGTSDIIESLFGKYKHFKAKGALMGYTKTVLNMAAFTAKLSVDEIHSAMENTTEKILHIWAKENIGETVFAKRKRYLYKSQNGMKKIDHQT